MMIWITLSVSSKIIYDGEGWEYTKVPIPAGNFNITGPLLASTCANVGLQTPCPGPKSCYSQKMCVTTSHSAGYCYSNLYNLQTKLNALHGSRHDVLDYSFVYRSSSRNVSEDVKIDGACGYWPTFYCKNGEEKPSTGSYFAMCVKENSHYQAPEIPPEMIYSGEGWNYTKVQIPAGNYNVTGALLASTCKQVGLETPCPSPQSCYSEKLCVTTTHTLGYCTSNLIILQQRLAAQYGSRGYSKLHYSFVYMKSRKNVNEDVKVDSACGYWPGSYCTNGEEKPSTGTYFAICVSDSTMTPTTTLSTTTKGDSHFAY